VQRYYRVVRFLDGAITFSCFLNCEKESCAEQYPFCKYIAFEKKQRERERERESQRKEMMMMLTAFAVGSFFHIAAMLLLSCCRYTMRNNSEIHGHEMGLLYLDR